MRLERAAGILLHPTSLAGKYGIGDFGPGAFEFCSRLANAGQTYWQMLPLGPTGFGDSPYQSLSAFAGNTLLISPEKLVEDGLLIRSEIAGFQYSDDGRVAYAAVREWKESILRVAFDRFGKGDLFNAEFAKFCDENSHWLDDYSLYRAIKSSQGDSAWFQWPEDVRGREPQAINRTRDELGGEIRFRQFSQFIFYRQWWALREHAASFGIKIIGDIPIFVALDSCDVWTRQSEFKLNPDGTPKVVAGVPPDYFSKTGQLWGNPICDWERMRETGFSWWTERFRHILNMVDVIRIDHFRGFVGTWEVPGNDETAENGQWVDVPGRELFMALKNALGDLAVIAEDLGAITPEVEALRDEFGFPGMRILEYAFGGDARNRDLPHNYERNTVAYTGTHDNDTTAGWFASLGEKTHEHCLNYLDARPDDVTWAMVRALYSSVADTVIVPMQDILGLDSDARMNTPATTSGNWQWRMSAAAFDEAKVERLARLSNLYGREPQRA